MNTSECSIFRDLSQNVWYHVIVTAKGTICMAGAVRVSQQWQTNGVRFLVHENTKIMFRFYYALNIMFSTIFAILYFSELIRLRFECLLYDFRYVLLTRCVGIATIFAAHQLIIVIAFERLYSTIFPAHFEKNSSKLLSVFIAVIAIASVYIFFMMKISNNFSLFYPRKVALLNESVPENRKGFQTLVATMALGNCLSLLILPLDLYLNFLRKSKTGTSLGVSYQRSENRRILLTLLPIELTQTFLGLSTSVALTVHGKFISSPTPVAQQLFLELVTFTTLVPLILAFFVKYSVEKYTNRLPPVDPKVDHFEALRQCWNA